MPRGQCQRAWENPLARAPRGQYLEGIDCEKARTHWLNVGWVGTELFSLPSHHVRIQKCLKNSLVFNTQCLLWYYSSSDLYVSREPVCACAGFRIVLARKELGGTVVVLLTELPKIDVEDVLREHINFSNSHVVVLLAIRPRRPAHPQSPFVSRDMLRDFKWWL